MAPVPPTDDTLFALVVERNVDALAYLYDRYAPHIFIMVKRIVKDNIIAEGLLQEVFLQVWEKSHTYSGDGSVAAWMCRIARNKGLDHLRRAHSRAQVIYKAVDDVGVLLEDTTTQGPDLQVAQQFQHAHLQTALQQLPSEQEACIRLAFFEGMSHTEIAVLTRTPLGTVKTRIRSGLSKLALVLGTYGYHDYECVS